MNKQETSAVNEMSEESTGQKLYGTHLDFCDKVRMHKTANCTCATELSEKTEEKCFCDCHEENIRDCIQCSCSGRTVTITPKESVLSETELDPATREEGQHIRSLLSESSELSQEWDSDKLYDKLYEKTMSHLNWRTCTCCQRAKILQDKTIHHYKMVKTGKLGRQDMEKAFEAGRIDERNKLKEYVEERRNWLKVNRFDKDESLEDLITYLDK